MQSFSMVLPGKFVFIMSVLSELIFKSYFSENVRVDEIPQEYRQEAEEYKHELVECLADVDEILGDLFLEEKKPTDGEIKVFLRNFNFT